MRYVLAIDLGTSGPKAAIVSEAGEIVARASEKVGVIFLPGGGAEQDANQWWECAKRAAQRALRESAVAARDIVAVSCDSQYSLVVPVDERLQPLMNAVHWLDTRGGRYNRALVRGFPSFRGYGLLKVFRWLRRTGLAPTLSGIDSLGHMLFVKNELPDLYRKTFKFLEPMDYLTSRLVGRCVASQHTEILMLLVDNRRWSNRQYDDALLKLGGIDKEKLPELATNGAIVGPIAPDIAAELGLSPDTQVAAASPTPRPARSAAARSTITTRCFASAPR